MLDRSFEVFKFARAMDTNTHTHTDTLSLASAIAAPDLSHKREANNTFSSFATPN